MKTENLRKLLEYMELGEQISEPIAVTGGLLHKMYQVQTESGQYAIKVLNPSIMQREHVIENYENSEKISFALSHKVPVVGAIQKNGKLVTEINGEHFMVFPWKDGCSIFLPELTAKHCEVIGEVLGKIHCCNLSLENVKKKEFHEEQFDWEELVNKAAASGVSWADEMKMKKSKLYEWTESANQAKKNLWKNQVLSHRDLDPKNVLWNGNDVYIIDWESAGYVNSYQELIEVINYWTVDEAGQLQKDKFDSLILGYKKSVMVSGVDWKSALNSGFLGMLGWLEYSMKRSLGLEGSTEEEIETGTRQVTGTIVNLEQYEKQAKTLQCWLKEC